MNALVLRVLACVTMLIDHYGLLYQPMDINYRLVGRLSFPLFAFLIANGFHHTRSKSRYLLRLTAFALISEIPFDLTFNFSILEFTRQNIFFTLALGLAGLMCKERLSETWGYYPASALALMLSGSIAEAAGASYGFIGVLTIFLFHMWQEKKLPLTLTLGVMGAAFLLMTWPSWVQFWGVLAIIPVALYNGEPGFRHPALQYFFYLFYPAHLLALHFLPL